MPFSTYPVWSFPPNWDAGVLERLEFKTDVLASETGHEQRVSRRLTPRRFLEASFLLHATNRQYYVNMLAKNGAKVWVVPLWHQVAKLTATALAGGTSLTFDTTYREYAAGNYVMLRGPNAQAWEVVEVAAVASGGLTVASALENEWPAGTWVYPAVLGRLENTTRTSKKTDRLSELRAMFQIAQTNAYSSAWVPDTYRDLNVIAVRPDDSEDLTHEHLRLLETIDNLNGIPLNYDVAGREFRKLQYRWSFKGRDKNDELRRTLYWLRGRARAVWLPTYMDDFTLASDIAAGATTISVNNAGFARLAVLGEGYQDIRIETKGRVVYNRRITAADEISGAVEVLTLDSALPDAISVDQCACISLMTIARLDQDLIEISHATDTDGLTQCVVTFSECLEAAAAETPVVSTGQIWQATLYDWGDTDVSEPIQPSGGLYLSDVGEFLVPTYDDFQSFMGLHRRSATDFSDLGTVANLLGTDPAPVANPWDLDMGDPDYVNDVDASYAYFAGISGQIFRVDKTAWTLKEFTPTSVAVPLDQQATFGTTLNVNYNRLIRNPYNGDIYAGNQNSTSVIHRLNKTDPNLNPEATWFLNGESAVILTSPYSGQPDVTSYYASGHFIRMGDIVFVSATEAYMEDASTSHIFHLNLTTGVATYVTRLTNGAASFSMHKPVYYDEPANTLWLYGANNSWFEDYMNEPVLTGHSVRKWVVGTNPSTIEDFPLMYDGELLNEGTEGDQDVANKSQMVAVDPFNRGLWLVYSYTYTSTTTGGNVDYTEFSPQMRFFSFVDEEITMIVDTADVVNGQRDAPFGFLGLDMLSATAGWGVLSYTSTNPSSFVATKITLDGERSQIPEARYVRIIIEKHAQLAYNGSNTHFSGLGGPVGIQEIEVHASRNGADIAQSVTATSEDPSFPASNLLSGNIVDKAQAWRAASTTYEHTITIDCGTVQPLYEVAMWPVNSRIPGIGGFSGTNYSEGRIIAPGTFRIETSVDGTTWTPRRRYASVYAWSVGQNPPTDRPARRCFECF